MKKKIIDGICGLVERLIKNPINYVKTPDWKKTPLRRFEDKYTPMGFKAHLLELGLNKDYALQLSMEYENRAYMPAIAEHIRINDDNDYQFRTG